MNVYDALASAIYVARQNLTGAAIDTDDKRLRASGLYEDWAEGAYTVGDIRNAGGQTWECFQAHDTATYPDIHPDNAAWFTFWSRHPPGQRRLVHLLAAPPRQEPGDRPALRAGAGRPRHVPGGGVHGLHRRQDLQVPERHQLLPRGLRPGLGGRGGIKLHAPWRTAVRGKGCGA